MGKAKYPRETGTAYHEAGHAVMTFIQGRRIKEASVVPNEAEGSLGHVEHPPLPWNFAPDVHCDGRTVRRLEELVYVSLAGLAAKKILTGRYDWRGSENDRRSACDCLQFLASEPNELGHYFDLILARSVNILKHGRGGLWWKAVERLASVLLQEREMSGQAVKKVIQEVIDEADRRIEEKARATVERMREIDGVWKVG